MVIYTAKLQPRRLLRFLLPLLGILIVLLLVRGFLGRSAASSLKDNDARVGYLQSLGYEVEPEPLSSAELTVPLTLDGVYADYAALQEEQGYPLADYCGRRAVRYTYAVTNYPTGEANVQANLLICDGTVIAGDLCSVALDGWMRALC
ncbi:MAG TPA: DUF4830 domain-containing protein [Oscillospiraceae bacterium]|nr:DUF4830 domain-containing protein [Oscillospiraceae bacterium]